MSRNAWIALAIGGLALLLLWSSKRRGSIASVANGGLNPPPAAKAPLSPAGAAQLNAQNMAKNLTPPAPVQKLLGFVGL